MVDDQQHQNDALRYAAEEWRITFDSIADPISIHDNEFRIVRLNKAFARAYGNGDVSSILGRRCYEVVHNATGPSPECPHRRIMKDLQAVTYEHFDAAHGRHLEISMAPVIDDRQKMTGVVQISKDITERKQMEESLIVTDRMASLGEMASGLAHEVNNPLTGVIGFTQLLLEDKRLPPELRGDLEMVGAEARRAADIVRKLLNLARQGSSEQGRIDVNAVLKTVLQIRAHELRMKNIVVDTNLDPELSPVNADPLELQQVFINLVINAEYFMSRARNGGRLTVITEQHAGNVRVIIADDGPGISRTRISQIFSPFYTTKEMGQGTGLGLSICRGIVTRYGGHIRVESEEGWGARFIVDLPSAVAEDDGLDLTVFSV
ncbi:ATP-binding protein [Dehalogenimonas sp. THU2]|uniref:two-component system sensor histidine kinase NtrB n=1 Tax=Dehalogenimonas sp. THU2 TaxID=3151121 RepID=UPI003218C17D